MRLFHPKAGFAAAVLWLFATACQEPTDRPNSPRNSPKTRGETSTSADKGKRPIHANRQEASGLADKIDEVFGGGRVPSVDEVRTLMAAITKQSRDARPFGSRSCAESARWEDVVKAATAERDWETVMAVGTEKICSGDPAYCTDESINPRRCGDEASPQCLCTNWLNYKCIASIARGRVDRDACRRAVQWEVVDDNESPASALDEKALSELLEQYQALFQQGDKTFCEALRGGAQRDCKAISRAAVASAKRACSGLKPADSARDCAYVVAVFRAARSNKPGECGGRAACLALLGHPSVCGKNKLTERRRLAIKRYCEHSRHTKGLREFNIARSEAKKRLAYLRYYLDSEWTGRGSTRDLPPAIINEIDSADRWLDKAYE